MYKKGDSAKIDLGRHLINFFELYGTKFNIDDLGISIRKDGFYYSKVKRGWYNYDEKVRISVENPQDPEVDIGFNAYNFR